jgi:hypothetical protein
VPKRSTLGRLGGVAEEATKGLGAAMLMVAPTLELVWVSWSKSEEKPCVFQRFLRSPDGHGSAQASACTVPVRSIGLKCERGVTK